MMAEISFSEKMKPNYKKVKAVWADLLAEYYDSSGKLKANYTVDVACHHCGSETIKPHSEFSINGFNHVSCKDCGTVYVTPRLKDGLLEKLYNCEYYSEIYSESMLKSFEVRKQTIG